MIACQGAMVKDDIHASGAFNICWSRKGLSVRARLSSNARSLNWLQFAHPPGPPSSPTCVRRKAAITQESGLHQMTHYLQNAKEAEAGTGPTRK